MTDIPNPNGIELADLMAALPGGAFVIDGVGTILYTTEEVAALVGRTPAELVGDSVLSYVSEETAWIYAAAVAMAGDYADVVGGPMRITVITADGEERDATLWTKNLLDDPRIGGIVCLVTYETAAMGIGEAVGALADHAPFPEVAAKVCTAMRGHAVVADAMLVARGETGFRPVAAVGVPDDLLDLLAEGPWDEAVTTGVRVLIDDVAKLPPALAEAATAAGYEAVWVEPVLDGELPCRGALVAWRNRAPHLPTPNQITSMHHGAAIVSIAWERHEAMA